ncbi:HAD family hydrolase [Petropleomorpha daqingensis]|uniref:HAD superfamily hydrolase (TIGR01509 family) n=1 Tax=Petropleomorpha daqingensis TaxID=2026353 RepID=A0A853CLX6_9ACTN|nr:HAD family phosphatase [Petropleomorpha daqingensis]NYJ08181.1 HAD superfamily hydrolase (TIGR01509 family) [Petropleomorpha daqingensis]
MSTAAGTPYRPSAVLFDMDGTLVETEESWGEALATLARRHGGEVSPAARAATVGTSMPVALGILYADLGLPADEVRLATDTAWVLDLMVELLAADLAWQPGARELLAEVRGAGVRTALVTTTPRQLADPLIGRMAADLGGMPFDVTVCGDEVPANKPDPAPYLQAMVALGVEPAGSVVIEDSPSGAAAGLAAGAAVLGVPSLQPIPTAPGLVLRDSLAGVGLAELADVLADRVEEDPAA